MTDYSDDDRDLGSKGPDAFRTISEVAEDLGLPQHVLRFWETRFPQIRPIKRGGGRRYYRPADVDLLRGVKQLLYGEGYTIRGVQRILREQGGRKLAQDVGARPGGAQPPGEPVPGPTSEPAAPPPPGPEIWASGRRASPADLRPVDDPDVGLPSYDDDETPVASAPARQPAPRPGLTQEQIARLSEVLGELEACRRLIGRGS